jgi:phage shock protein PspC (stress-responsive transcriptional regulator)
MTRRSEGRLLPPRPVQGRLIAGVCAAIADRLVVDVTLVRLAFLLLALAWGVGVVLYSVLWIVMPDAGGSEGTVRGGTFRATAGRVNVDLGHARHRFAESWRRAGMEPWPRPLGRRWMAIGLVVVGVAIFLLSIGALDWINAPRALGLALVAGGISLIVAMRSGS